MADVFISYAREDLETAGRIARALEALGWTVWWDEDLAAGHRFDDVIERELAAAGCVVVLWSREARKSDWVRDEADFARQRGVLVGARIDDAEPPLGFRGSHVADLTSWDGSPTHRELLRVTRGVASHVLPSRDAGRSQAAARPSEPAAGPAVKAKERKRPSVGGGNEAAKSRFDRVLEQHRSSPEDRVRAVEAFVQKEGDPRFRTDAWFLPGDPLLGFLEVPSGPFWMGSNKARDPHAYDDEMPAHELTLPTFYVARWPVTVAQFAAFVEESGFKPEHANTLPGVANHPVVWLPRHDALEYCAWLTRKLRGWAGTPEALARVLRGEGGGGRWQVTLPSEAEWEKAARGSDGRIYPWGDEPDPNRANYDETGVGATSPVGCFPRGRSPCGAEDMSGNVWEWTRSMYRPYPYAATDGRETPEATEGRVGRGGAWGHDRACARAACRFDEVANVRGDLVGFRVVCVSPIR